MLDSSKQRFYDYFFSFFECKGKIASFFIIMHPNFLFISPLKTSTIVVYFLLNSEFCYL